jgi:hypothetical protein
MLLCQTQIRNDSRSQNAEKKAKGEQVMRGQKRQPHKEVDSESGTFFWCSNLGVPIEQDSSAVEQIDELSRDVGVDDNDDEEVSQSVYQLSFQY